MVTQPLFDLRTEEVAEICRDIGVKRLDLVGDAATGGDEPDFFVEFFPDARQPWMGEVSGLLERLRALYGLRVHLIEKGSPYYSEHREWIDAARMPVYEA